MPDQKTRCSLAQRSQTVLLVVDFQEKFRPVIANFGGILEKLILATRSAGILKVPIMVTEQYPKGLGTTVEELQPFLAGVERITKTDFSCFKEGRFLEELRKVQVDTLILGGVEAHVCVAQTALHAVSEGYQVHVLEDAVGSRNPEHAGIALKRLREAGVVISCTEMAVFELLGCAGTLEFKEVQKLIKT